MQAFLQTKRRARAALQRWHTNTHIPSDRELFRLSMKFKHYKCSFFDLNKVSVSCKSSCLTAIFDSPRSVFSIGFSKLWRIGSFHLEWGRLMKIKISNQPRLHSA